MVLYDAGGISAIDAHYASLSARFGFERATPADTVFTIANTLFGANRLDNVATLIDTESERYLPQIMTQLADRYEEAGEDTRALRYYRRAHEVSPGLTEVRQKLADLGEVVSQPDVALSEALLQQYAGFYYYPPKFGLTATVENSTLYIEIPGFTEPRPAQPMSQQRFYFDGSRLQCEFSRDESGAVSIVTILGYGDPIVARRWK